MIHTSKWTVLFAWSVSLLFSAGALARDFDDTDYQVSSDPSGSINAPTKQSDARAQESPFNIRLGGHINPAFNIVDDGQSTDTYVVDNDVDHAQITLDADGRIAPKIRIGAIVNVALSPYNSADVSQRDKSPEAFIDLWQADLWLAHDNAGTFFAGKGQGAADDTAEYDLSYTGGVIQYSGIADPVAGIILRHKDGAYSDLTIGDTFFNFDGVDPHKRIGYVTPSLGNGIQIATSYGNNNRWDVAVKWGYDNNQWTGVDLGAFTVLGGVAVSDPAEGNTDYRVGGSLSTLHDASGISLTVSAGTDIGDTNGPDPYNFYSKIGYDFHPFGFGTTGFGIDYTYSKHLIDAGVSGESVGISAAQSIEKLGVDLYFQYREYTPGNGTDLKTVRAATIGSRIGF